MSDLFHEEIPVAYVRRVFDVMRRATQHQFQVLTKRSARMATVVAKIRVPANVWLGVSVENAQYASRIDDLRLIECSVRFLSIEPLLGPIPKINLNGIHWVIVGGESGHGARAMSVEWVRSIRDQCAKAGVAFFFKQWGGVRKRTTGRLLDGRTWDEMPERLVGVGRNLAVVNG
jgi:protein gp37